MMSMEDCEAAPDRDRLSELPQPLLHHMLCFLPRKEAVQTCVLSKSWRCLGSTRPKLQFLHRDYDKHTFLSILDKTLHMYRDQKLYIQDLHVKFRTIQDPKTVEFLKEWFPFIVATMSGVKTLHLSLFGSREPGYVDLPPELFENSKSLRSLSLCGFRFSQNLAMDKVHHLKHLQTLSLTFVHVVDETFRNIMSSCRHIERLVLWGCEGLTTIRLMEKSCLKSLELSCCDEDRLNLKDDVCLVDVPNLESLYISMCDNWWFSFDNDRHHQRNMYFPGLKSLVLFELRLPALPSLDILSCDFPCLQHLKIVSCSGYGQLRVSNRSINHLNISYLDKSTKVVVDAPNMEVLDYVWSLPMDISFATTSNECTSNIRPSSYDLSSQDGHQRLSTLLQAVSQTKIFLKLPHEDDNGNESDYEEDSDNESHEDDNDNENHEDANDYHENHGDDNDNNDYHEDANDHEENNDNESHHEEDNDNENHEDANDYHENQEEANDYHENHEEANENENHEDDNDYHQNHEEAHENENHEDDSDYDYDYDDPSDEHDNNINNDYQYEKPVPVEYLHLDDKEDGHGFFYSEAFLNRMFRYCRPRNILERECTRCSWFLCKLLLLRHKNGIPYYYWQRDLEEASMHVWDQKSQEWHLVEGTPFPESGARLPSDISRKQHQVWFKLKWRE